MMAFWCEICGGFVQEGGQRDGDIEFSGLNHYGHNGVNLPLWLQKGDKRFNNFQQKRRGI